MSHDADREADRLRQDRPHQLHRLRRRRPRHRARRRRHLRRRSGSSSAARTRPMCAPTPSSTMPSRIWSTARSTIPANAAAASSASTSTRASMTISSRASPISPANMCVGNPLDQSTTLGPMARACFADTVRGQTAEALRKGATALINMKARRRPAGLALSRAGGADQRQSPDGGDARGELRARGRHHEGARRRGGDHADERQSLWTDGLDLDARPGPRRRASAHASRPARST